LSWLGLFFYLHQECVMNTVLKSVCAAALVALAAQASAQVIFYENADFQGRSFTAEQAVDNFQRYGFNDRASSVVVLNKLWEVCQDANYGGECVALRPGRYPSLAAMGLNDRVSSVRIMDTRRANRRDEVRYAPEPTPVYDNRRRPGERLYEANVTAVRAVMGPPQQRCWVEHSPATRGNNGVPGAVVGALIGGVLGHQVGGGSGRDLATMGGAVAGAAVGANVGRRSGNGQAAQDVQRCAEAPNSGPPSYWDVNYQFRGRAHRIQMANQPGPTITVNRQGEPRS
jgi:uncharacterized protein YcfJ